MLKETMPIRSDYTANTPRVPAASKAVAAPKPPAAVWRVRCVGWASAAIPGRDLLGYIDVEVSPGLRLRDLRIYKTCVGPKVVFPARAIMQDGECVRRRDGRLLGIKPVVIPDDAARAAFGRAVLGALKLFAPDALADAAAAAALPPAPPGAPAMARSPA